MDPNPQPMTKSPETEGKRRLPSQRGDASWKAYSDQWKENHGTLLMIFAAAIVAIGTGILAFQQNRFRKPSFPSSQMFPKAADPDQLTSAQDSTELLAASSEGNPTFQLRIVGISPADVPAGGGQIRIAIYSSSEHFNQPEFAISKQSLPIASEGEMTSTIPLEPLPPTIAIAAFQDVNENGKLDRNALGMPSERYGFSNDARGKVGPPSFDEALVALPEPGGELEIRIR